MEFRGTRAFLVGLAVIVAAGPVRAQAPSEVPPEAIHYADTVLYNGKILTADEKFSIVEAVAIRDGKFLAVGDSGRILRIAGPATKKIDLAGKTAVPGIIDLHQHPFAHGIQIYRYQK